MAHSTKSKPAASFIDFPLSFRRKGGGFKTQVVRIRDQGSREANNAAAMQRAGQLGYSASDVEPFFTGEGE